MSLETDAHARSLRRTARSVAARLKIESPAEERHHVVLEAFGHLACVRALIHFEAVSDPVPVEDFVQLPASARKPS